MNDSSPCLEFSRKVATGIFVTKTVVWSIGILLSLIMIAIMVTKHFRRLFLYRLLTYLMATSTLQGFCQILGQLPVEVTEDGRTTLKNGSGWRRACTSFAYLDVVTTWMTNFVIIWIMLLMVWYYYRLATGYHSNVQRLNRISCVREVIGVLIAILCSFVISCIPFIKDMYGISGTWCWIKTISENDCLDIDLQKFSLGLTVITFCPQFVCLIFGSLCIIAIMGSYLRVPKTLHGQGRWHYRNSIKTIGMIFLYAIFLSLPSLLPWANRMYIFYDTNSNPSPLNYILWTMHAVADPSRVLVLDLALFMNSHIRRIICFRRSSANYAIKQTDQPTVRPSTPRPASSTMFNIPYTSNSMNHTDPESVLSRVS